MTSKRVNFTLEEELHTEASKYAEDRGMSFSGLVARALTRYMQEGDSSPGPSPALTPSKEELIPVNGSFAKFGDSSKELLLPQKKNSSRLWRLLSDPVKWESTSKP